MSEFMEVKTAELTGAGLDWAVAIAEGAKVERPQDGQVSFNGAHRVCGNETDHGFKAPFYSPSTDWSQGGPLIEKYKIDIGAPLDTQSGPWNASAEWGHPDGFKGDTPLIAACRAIVASVLGDTVSVPKELV